MRLCYDVSAGGRLLQVVTNCYSGIGCYNGTNVTIGTVVVTL